MNYLSSNIGPPWLLSGTRRNQRPILNRFFHLNTSFWTSRSEMAVIKTLALLRNFLKSLLCLGASFPGGKFCFLAWKGQLLLYFLLLLLWVGKWPHKTSFCLYRTRKWSNRVPLRPWVFDRPASILLSELSLIYLQWQPAWFVNNGLCSRKLIWKQSDRVTTSIIAQLF